MKDRILVCEKAAVNPAICFCQKGFRQRFRDASRRVMMMRADWS